MADYLSQFTGSEIDSRLAKVSQLETGKQDTLVSGTNIKTINGQSVVGSGNLQIREGDPNAVKFTEQTLTDAQKEQARANIDAASLEDVTALNDAEYVVAWDGTSTPVVANIPAGVTVTYNTTTYTGTLAASASTAGNIYLVKNSSNYDMYVSTASGSSYSWVGIGSTALDLSGYATTAQVSQLEHEVGRLAGRYYGVFPTAEDLPEGEANGYAFVGANEPFAIYNFVDGEWEDSGSEAVGIQGPQGNSGYTGAAGELEVVNNLEDGGATAALSADAGKLLARNMKLLYDSLGAAAFWGDKPDIDWSGNAVPVSISLENCTIDNIASSVPLGDSYEATITPDAGNILASVICTMNGEPQTVVNGVISIAEVTGSITITAKGANLDTVVFDGKSYKQIFETNNALGINPGFENGSYSPLTVNAGSPTITTEDADSGTYSLKASGTSSAQVKSGNKSGAAFIACRVKVTSYTAGSCGCQYDYTAGVNRVTDGWETAYQNRTGTSQAVCYVGSFNSANLTGYVDTPVVILKSTFSTVPTFDEFKALYDQYVAIKRAV